MECRGREVLKAQRPVPERRTGETDSLGPTFRIGYPHPRPPSSHLLIRSEPLSVRFGCSCAGLEAMRQESSQHNPSYLTPPEVAKLLRVSQQKVLGWISRAELRAVNVGN